MLIILYGFKTIIIVSIILSLLLCVVIIFLTIPKTIRKLEEQSENLFEEISTVRNVICYTNAYAMYENKGCGGSLFLTEDAVEFYIFSAVSGKGQNILILLDDIIAVAADKYNLKILTKEQAFSFMLLIQAEALRKHIADEVAK